MGPFCWDDVACSVCLLDFVAIKFAAVTYEL
jgi:hypothetical protein